MSENPDTSLPFVTRLWFAFACLFHVLFDGQFAARLWRVRDTEHGLPPADQPVPLPPAPRPEPPVAEPAAPEPLSPTPKPEAPSAEPAAPNVTPALQLLALLQREGRFVDFVEQDIASFGDAEIGAAARMVHEGCRKALRSHATLTSVRSEEEGTKVTLEAGFSPSEVKLIGNVAGSAPYKGVLRHRGWRAERLSLPTPVSGHDPNVVAPAEVEL